MPFILKALCCVCSVAGHVQLFANQWTVAQQAPVFMGLSRQEYWSRLPFSPPGDLPNPGMENMSLASPALAGGLCWGFSPQDLEVMNLKE